MNRKEIKKGRHSQEPLLGIFNACRGCLSLRKQQCVEDPRYQHSGMTASCGFTLIELLVVVLIIGILSAIALPQYEKAVVKARLATIKPIMASIKQAEEIYYMANQKYTGDERELDINISCEKTNDPSVFVCGDFFVLDLIAGPLAPNTSVIDAHYCSNKVTSWSDCAGTDTEFIYRVWLDYSSYPNKTQCIPATAKGTKLCNML